MNSNVKVVAALRENDGVVVQDNRVYVALSTVEGVRVGLALNALQFLAEGRTNEARILTQLSKSVAQIEAAAKEVAGELTQADKA